MLEFEKRTLILYENNFNPRPGLILSPCTDQYFKNVIKMKTNKKEIKSMQPILLGSH